MDAARARKLADRISQIVAEMLERRIKDPRLGFATITESRLTNDLREATVFYTVYGTDAARTTRSGRSPAAHEATVYYPAHDTDAERADTPPARHSAAGAIRWEGGR